MTSEGVPWAGGNSEGETASTGSDADGSDACGSLAVAYVESRRHVVTKLLPRGRDNLVVARDLLCQALGCKENG
jgi:hypothetical protein